MNDTLISTIVGGTIGFLSAAIPNIILYLSTRDAGAQKRAALGRIRALKEVQLHMACTEALLDHLEKAQPDARRQTLRNNAREAARQATGLEFTFDGPAEVRKMIEILEGKTNEI